MSVTLGYWDILGLAEPIRLMLEYLGVDYVDKRYKFGSSAETLRDEWFVEKHKLGLDFPNLPYYIDGDVRMTQSHAILRYIARKHNLLGETEADKIRTDMCEQQCVDLRMNFVKLIFLGNFEKDRDAFLVALPDKLREFDTFLGGKYDWFGGSKISFVDFLMYGTLHWHRLLSTSSLESFEHLNAFMKRFEALPRVSEHVKNDKFKNRAIFAPFAQWGGKPIPQ